MCFSAQRRTLLSSSNWTLSTEERCSEEGSDCSTCSILLKESGCQHLCSPLFRAGGLRCLIPTWLFALISFDTKSIGESPFFRKTTSRPCAPLVQFVVRFAPKAFHAPPEVYEEAQMSCVFVMCVVVWFSMVPSGREACISVRMIYTNLWRLSRCSLLDYSPKNVQKVNNKMNLFRYNRYWQRRPLNYCLYTGGGLCVTKSLLTRHGRIKAGGKIRGIYGGDATWAFSR